MKERWGRLVKAENLQSEISYRFNLVNRKRENLNDLDDYQLLELNRNRNLETEFNDIFDKITILASMVPKDGDKVENMLKLNLKKETFLKNLEKIVADRDVTSDKIKNDAGLKIDLTKFSGYDSSNVYTFNSQFKKVIEPTVSK